MCFLKKMNGDVLIIRLLEFFRKNETMEFKKKSKQFLLENINKFVINFKNLTFISSIGIRELLILSKISKDLGGGLTLCNLSEIHKKTFAEMGILKIFDISNSEEEAVNNFNKF